MLQAARALPLSRGPPGAGEAAPGATPHQAPLKTKHRHFSGPWGPALHAAPGET